MEESLSLISKNLSPITTVEKYEVARTGPKVKDTDPVIMKMVLVYCFNVIGLPDKQIPVNDKQIVLVKFIRDYYENMTVDEIKLAFDLLAKGELQINPSLYGHSFSPQYFGAVIRAYKEYYQKKTKGENKSLDKKMPELKTTPEQMYNGLIKYIEEKKSIPLLWGWDMVFGHMESIKVLADSIEEKQMFADQVKAAIIEESNGQRLNLDFDRAKEVKGIIDDKEKFKSRCRKERVIVYLKAHYGL